MGRGGREVGVGSLTRGVGEGQGGIRLPVHEPQRASLVATRISRRAELRASQKNREDDRADVSRLYDRASFHGCRTTGAEPRGGLASGARLPGPSDPPSCWAGYLAEIGTARPT